MDRLYKVVVDEAIRLECVADDHLNQRTNDCCIVRCDRYEDFGRVVFEGDLPELAVVAEMPRVTRHATLVDQGKAHENQVRSKSMHRAAVKKIAKHKLPMRLVSTHFAFDRSLVIFIFMAPGRVDFRALLKDLNRTLHTRVELRQIGPRDQAAMTGGLGSCGRPLCCATFIDNFVSINVRMAKAQGLSLNPSNIIGACGRLKCCLEFELEGYRELMSGLPHPGSRCQYEGQSARVIDNNALLQTVKLAVANQDRLVNVPVSEISLNRERNKQR